MAFQTKRHLWFCTLYSFMKDASRILEDVSDAYMDYAHYSRKGNEVISEYVLECVENFFQKREDK